MKDIIKKFKFKSNAIVINSPTNFESEFSALGFKLVFDKKNKSPNTLVFVIDKKYLLDFLSQQLKYIEPDSVFWLAYPKASSKIITDINRDTIRTTAELFNITTVTAIAIDDTWSALRFRPIDRVGK